MNTQTLIDALKKANEINTPIKKYTFIVNDKSETQGALFFIPVNSKEFKVLIPAPFHLDLLSEDRIPTHSQILNHKESLLLK